MGDNPSHLFATINIQKPVVAYGKSQSDGATNWDYNEDNNDLINKSKEHGNDMWERMVWKSKRK